MAEKQTIKVLVVEDEILLALDLSAMLSGMHFEVVDTVSTVDDALEVLRNKDIDIVLVDIVLKGDKDGVELATVIRDRHHLPFIFLSSHYDTELIERVKGVHPAGYLLKPSNQREVKIAIELALANFNTPANNERTLPNKQQELQINDSLFLKKDQHFQRVTLDDILLLEADNNYTRIYSTTDQFLYSTVLKKMEEKLPASQFLRVHRSYVVNIQRITGFEGNMLFIDDKRIPVSKQYREQVFRLFKAV